MTKVAIINFNAPELHQLGVYLAERGQLESCVRLYLNRGRWWERALEHVPWLGQQYRSTFGRRRLDSAKFNERAVEKGILPDLLLAVLMRTRMLPHTTQQRVAEFLNRWIRSAVSAAGPLHLGNATSIIAYPGFAQPAFSAARICPTRRFLNYPIAHHRYHLAKRNEEAERMPAFAATWPELAGFTTRYLEDLDREIAASDRVVVGSTFCARTFVESGVESDRVVTIPYGVDLGVFTPQDLPRPAEFGVIYAGQLSQRKGMSYLLQAYGKFAAPGTRLTLVGNPLGPMEPYKPWRHLFNHVAHLTRRLLAEEYCRHDVFVFPTLLEGMGLVVAEAMASGLPVITTANGPDELVRDGLDGFIVPERDPDAIADRLEQLRANPALRLRMGASAARRAREFTWEVFCQRYRMLLDSDTAN